MAETPQSHTDPTDRKDTSHPGQNSYDSEKAGMAQFKPVVFWAAGFILFALLAAFLLLSATGRKLVPGKWNPHPTSQLLHHPLPATQSQTQSA